MFIIGKKESEKFVVSSTYLKKPVRALSLLAGYLITAANTNIQIWRLNEQQPVQFEYANLHSISR